MMHSVYTLARTTRTRDSTLPVKAQFKLQPQAQTHIGTTQHHNTTQHTTHRGLKWNKMSLPLALQLHLPPRSGPVCTVHVKVVTVGSGETCRGNRVTGTGNNHSELQHPTGLKGWGDGVD
jgi:hypothetical protein